MFLSSNDKTTILSFLFTADEDGISSELLNNVRTMFSLLKKTIVDYKNSLNGATPSVKGFTEALKQNKISAEAATATAGNFSASLVLLRAKALLLNAALGLGVGFLVSYGIKAFTEWKQRVDNAATSTKEAADAATDTTASVKELVDAYKELGDKSGWNSDDFEQAKDIQDQLLDLAKEQSSLDQDRVEALNLQNGKYEEQLDLLDKLTMKQLEAASYDLTTSKDAQGEKLVQTGKTQKRSHLLTILNSDEMSMADNIRDSGIDIENSLGGFGADNWKDPDSIVTYYNNIGKALQYVIDNTTEAERKAGGAYHNLYTFLIEEQDALKDDVDNYNDSTDAIKDNANARAKLAAVILMKGQKDSTTGGYSDYEKINSALETLKNTIDGFDSTKLNELLWGTNDGLSDEQVDALTVLRKAITDMDFSADTDGVNAFISALVQLGMVALNAADGLTGLQQAAQDMEEISKEIDNLQSAYKACSTAMEEYNKYGYMSADSLQSLLSMDTQYLSCLDLVDGKLQINKQRYAELLAAQYAQAEVTAIQQATEELKAIQDEATKEKVEGLTTATEEQQTAMENAIPAIKDTTVATGDLAVALAAAQGAAGDDETLNAKINAVTTALNTKLAAIHANTQAAINSGTALANQLNGFPTDKNTKKNKENAQSVTDVASAFDTLTKAMKEYNQYGYICADTMKSLIGVDDKFTACLTEQNGKLQINTKTFRTFVKAQLEEANASKDGGKSAAEMQRILDWLNSSVDTETISFEQLTDAIKGYGSAMDDAKEKTDSIKSAFSDLAEVSQNKIDNPFGLLDSDDVEKKYQAIRDLYDNTDLFTNDKYAGALNPETGDIDCNSDAFKDMFLDNLDKMITACKETGGTVGEYLAKGFEDAKQKIASNALSIEDYINGIGSTLSKINNSMDDYQSAFNDLSDIIDEYNAYGELSQDTIQKYMSLNPKYAACLEEEGGKLVFNKEAFRDLYVEQLKVLAETYKGTDLGDRYAEILEKVANGTWDVTDHMKGMGTEAQKLQSIISDLKDLFSSMVGIFEKFNSNKSNDLKIWGEAMTEEIDKRIEALQEQNDEQERAIELAKLQAELEKAQTQKTVRVYTSNGYEWQTDESAIKEARDNLSEKQRQWALDDEVDKLNKLKDKYSEIINLIGSDWDDYQKKLQYTAQIQNMTFDQMSAGLDGFKNNVVANMKQVATATTMTTVISNLTSLIDTLVKLNKVITEIGTGSATDGGITGLFNRIKSLFGKKSGGSGGKSGFFNNVLTSVKQLFSKKSSTNSIVPIITDGMSDVANAVEVSANSSGGVVGIFKNLWGTISNGATELFSSSSGGLVSIVSKGLGSVASAITTGGGPIVAGLVGIVATAAKNTSKLWSDQKEIWSSDDSTGKKIVKSVGNFLWRSTPVGAVASWLGFAKGTNSVPKDGIYNVDEEGKELIVHAPKRGRLTTLSKGDGVIPANTTENLMDIGKDPRKWLENAIKKNRSVKDIIASSVGKLTNFFGDSDVDRLKNANTKGDILSITKDLANGQMEKLRTKFESTWKEVAGDAGLAESQIKVISDAIFDRMGSMISGTMDSALNNKDLTDDEIKTLCSDMFQRMGYIYENGWDNLYSLSPNMSVEMSKNLHSLFDTINADYLTDTDGINNLLSEKLSEIQKDAGKTTPRKSRSSSSEYYGNSMDANAGGEPLLNLSKIKDNVKNLFEKFSNSKLGTWLSKNSLGATVDKLTKYSNSSDPNVIQKMLHLASHPSELAKFAVSSVVNTITGTRDTVKWAINNPDKIVEGVGKVAKSVYKSGKKIASDASYAASHPSETLKKVGETVSKAASDAVSWVKGKVDKVTGKKATGSRSINKAGTYNVDERGSELLVRQPQSGRYTYLETGDGVVPADITSRLFEMGGNPDAWFQEQLKKTGLTANIQSRDTGSSISIGDIYVQQPIGDVDSLARAINNELPNAILQQRRKR